MTVLEFAKARHTRASTAADSESVETGRGTSAGQAPSGQLSENHCIALSSRRVCMSAPPQIALSFLPSSKARELTVVSETPSSAAYARATVRSPSMPTIRPISVSLPDKSTAILPDARRWGSGHLTGMDWKPLLAIIDKGLSSKGWSADHASRVAGHPDAIRNMRRKSEGKLKGGITFDTVMDIANALEIAPEAIVRAAMGISAEADDRAAMRQEVLRDLRAEIDQQIAPKPRPKLKRAGNR